MTAPTPGQSAGYAGVPKVGTITSSASRDGLHWNWTIVANGRLYRVAMRVMHRLGWCYPEPVAVRPGAVWCHWCGMRGSRPVLTNPPTLNRVHTDSPSPERLPHADVPGLTPETCPERDHHGKPFRYCPVKGCGWHEGRNRG